MPAEPPSPDPGADPNRTQGGARQRRGPFWLEEPGWFWALAALTFAAGAILFLVAVGFDRP
ncbi:MAG: hypothetical protein ACREOD_08660 [Candidatus Dormibacteria bacterium]